MAEQLTPHEVNKVQVKTWRKRYRFSIQSMALVVALLSPFALYWGLEAGQNMLAALSFGLLALAMLVTAWIG
jgi:hypothetical protein